MSYRLAAYCITRNRYRLTRESLKMLKNWSGVELDLYVADNGSTDETVQFLHRLVKEKRIKHLIDYEENMGQNIAANDLLDSMGGGGYDLIMRWDNDALPRTRNFLRKLLRYYAVFEKHGVRPVVSPYITKLKNPPPPMAFGDDAGFPYELVAILGGICRIHPAEILRDWRFNRFGPMGFGEAGEMANFCDQIGVPLVRITNVKVEHAYGEDGQMKKYPEHFEWEERAPGRYMSYGL